MSLRFPPPLRGRARVGIAFLPSPWRGEGREGVEPVKLWSGVVAEQFESSFNHRIGVSQYFIVPKPNDAIAFGFEKAGAAHV